MVIRTPPCNQLFISNKCSFQIIDVVSLLRLHARCVLHGRTEHLQFKHTCMYAWILEIENYCTPWFRLRNDLSVMQKWLHVQGCMPYLRYILHTSLIFALIVHHYNWCALPLRLASCWRKIFPRTSGTCLGIVHQRVENCDTLFESRYVGATGYSRQNASVCAVGIDLVWSISNIFAFAFILQSFALRSFTWSVVHDMIWSDMPGRLAFSKPSNERVRWHFLLQRNCKYYCKVLWVWIVTVPSIASERRRRKTAIKLHPFFCFSSRF